MLLYPLHNQTMFLIKFKGNNINVVDEIILGIMTAVGQIKIRHVLFDT